MKLKAKKVQVDKPEVQKPRKDNKHNKLPSDRYKPMFEPIRFLVKEMHSYKDGSLIKDYLEISVKRFDDDEENAPMVYLQMYRESEMYTGYLKGKNVNFPLETLYEVMDYLSEIDEKCDELGIS